MVLRSIVAIGLVESVLVLWFIPDSTNQLSAAIVILYVTNLLSIIIEYYRILLVSLHCLFHLHPLGRWRDDWLRPHWYCRVCTPRRTQDTLFFPDY